VKLFELTFPEISREMKRHYGKGDFHAASIYREIFKKGNRDFGKAPEFLGSPALTARLAEDVRLPSCRIVARQYDGEVLKFASSLSDGKIIESVIIPAQSRTTLCVSSQVGCRMGCRFCTTGGMGFERNLFAEEIVWQVHAARFTLGRQIDNIVFMGMGEPLDNFDNVIQAVRVLSDQRGLDISHSHITISTAGHVEGIERLAALNFPKLRLAVSLNAAEDELRSSLMPINRRYPLEWLKGALQAFPLPRNGVFFMEYVLLAGVNDSPEDARKLTACIRDLPVRVNLIAYNGGSSARFEPPTLERVRQFYEWLAYSGVFVRIRQSRGQDIQAACGQLRASLSNKETTESVTEPVSEDSCTD
jgi:23S rRNA (adenine2503-C2)-methyltransferase